MAAQLGFDQCGIAKAGMLNEDARTAGALVKTKACMATCNTWKNHFDLRVDPGKTGAWR